MRAARSASVTAAVACVGLVVGPLPATAATPDRRSIATTHFSATSFDIVPVGSVVSVVQRCPAGSVLDKAETRAFSRELDGALQEEPNVRLVGRELWVAGLVARYRVVRRGGVPTEDGFGVLNGAICTTDVSAGTTRVSGSASTDVRVWGPAPAGVSLYSFTGVSVSDAADGDERAPFLTVVRAAGTAPSAGALPSGVRATQRLHDDAPILSTEGTTRQRVPGGRFASMRSSYTFTADLTKRMPDPEGPGPEED